MIAEVSPTQGHGSLASSSVTSSPALSPTGSRPTLYSQFRGPFLYNETDEERAKREAEEKRKEDEERKSNFKKVQEAREAAEAKVKELEEEKRQREAKDKEAADAKLAEEGKLKELADSKQKEAEAKAAEAAAALKRAEEAEAKLKVVEEQQEQELKAVLDSIPEDKRPPLDPTDPVSKRLSLAKHTAALVSQKKPDNMSGSPRKQGAEGKEERIAELKKKGFNALTADEALELAELSE